MTIMEAAKLWDLSPNWVRELIRKGRLPANLVQAPVPYYDIPSGTPRPGRRRGLRPIRAPALPPIQREQSPIVGCSCDGALIDGKVPTKEDKGHLHLRGSDIFDSCTIRRTDSHCDFCGQRNLFISYSLPEDPHRREVLENALGLLWRELEARLKSAT